MSDYPDIKDRASLVKAIGGIEVLGGFSRSLSIDPETGDYEPDRYVEKLADYFTDFAIGKAVDALFDQSICVDHWDAVITGYNRNEILVEDSGGAKVRFVRTVE